MHLPAAIRAAIIVRAEERFLALTLVIGSKTYSSWSLRPWLALAHHKIPFDEVLIPNGSADFKEKVAAFGAGKTVPILLDGKEKIWESIAILEYLAEKFPQVKLWQTDTVARAHARTISAEMHAGFPVLRGKYHFNLKRKRARRTHVPEVEPELARIQAIWRGARERFGKGGDFLFGEFSAADCMYAPVAGRIVSYELKVDHVASAYVEAIQALPAYRTWFDAAQSDLGLRADRRAGLIVPSVIPGAAAARRAKAYGPGSTNASTARFSTDCVYGFRPARFARDRNDEEVSLCGI
jgi:glutathione S-transferase